MTCDINDAISEVNLSDPPQDWNHDAVSQWAAGYLYGISGQTIDKRNYIVACTDYDEMLTKLLFSAMKDQCSGDTAQFMCKLDKAWSMLKISMYECTETNETFQRVEDFYSAFEQSRLSKDI